MTNAQHEELLHRLERIDEDDDDGTFELFETMDKNASSAFPVYFMSRVYGPRTFTIWLNNTIVVTWYALVFGGFLSKDLATRFVTLWLISSSNNLVGEHLSEYGTWRTLDFARDFLLNAIPFILGVVMVIFNLHILILTWIFTVSCIIYICNIYLRYHLAEHKTHRYSLYLEVLVHTVLPPILGCAIFAPNQIEEDLVFLCCLGCDIVLKLGRTIFVFTWDEPSYLRTESWAKEVSNESFIAAFTSWDGGAVEKVG